MRIKSVKYGVMSFGPAVGQRSLLLEFESDEGEGSLWEQFLALIDENSLNEQYLQGINGSKTVFFIFRGGEIEKAENEKAFDEFLAQLSQASLELQKSPDVKKTNMGKLSPPYLIFAGKPTVFSGSRDFYQRFNTVIALVQKRVPYSSVAHQEMMNHQFSTTAVWARTAEDVPGFRTPKVSVVAQSDDESLSFLAISKNYRYYRDYSTDMTFVFW
jgi:hypothetical protein